MTAVLEKTLPEEDVVPDHRIGSYLCNLDPYCHLLILGEGFIKVWVPICGAPGGLVPAQDSGWWHAAGSCPNGHPLCPECYPAADVETWVIYRRPLYVI